MAIALGNDKLIVTIAVALIIRANRFLQQPFLGCLLGICIMTFYQLILTTTDLSMYQPTPQDDRHILRL